MVNDKNGNLALTHTEALAHMQRVLRGELSPDEIRHLLVTYNDRAATSDELAGFLRAVREAATQIDLAPEVAGRAVDIVGTGGDQSGSVNVSTMAALVVAGAGVPVCKHGNRSASSKCGTADVLEALGARIEQTADQVSRAVAKTGFGFVFAPAFHPAFRHVGPIRRELGVPTIFNLLGPMANPAPVAHMLVGVADAQRMTTMAHALATRTTSSWVVHGHGGLDELSLAGPNRVIATVGGVVQAETVVDARTLNMARADNDELRGGDPAHNAGVVRGVLNGEIRGAVRDVVVFNAAAALVVAGAARDLAAGAILANAAIDGGTARATLDAYIAATVF